MDNTLTLGNFVYQSGSLRNAESSPLTVEQKFAFTEGQAKYVRLNSLFQAFFGEMPYSRTEILNAFYAPIKAPYSYLLETSWTSWANSAESKLGEKLRYIDSESINQFVLEYPEVRTYIDRAEKVIYKYFPDSQLSLELKTDHDAEEEFQEIFMHIRTTEPVSKSLELLGKVYEEVFVANGPDKTLFNIDLE